MNGSENSTRYQGISGCEEEDGTPKRGEDSILDPSTEGSIVAYVKHQASSLYMDGFVNDKEKLLLLDKVETKTIVRPDALT